MSAISLGSPLGPLAVHERNGAIVSLDWGAVERQDETNLLADAREQLAEYFAGERRVFDLPTDPAGNAFQRLVWREMCEIPYGRTETYGVIAARLGNSARAVGGACGANPIPIVIPCHRVVGAGGKLTGYSGHGGLATKKFLLDLESGHGDLFSRRA